MIPPTTVIESEIESKHILYNVVNELFARYVIPDAIVSDNKMDAKF